MALTQEKTNKSMEQNIYVYVYVYTHENLVFNRSDISVQGKVLGTIDLFANFVGCMFYILIFLYYYFCI